MYGQPDVSTMGPAVALGALPFMDLSVAWMVIVAATIIAMALALMKLVPRSEE